MSDRSETVPSPRAWSAEAGLEPPVHVAVHNSLECVRVRPTPSGGGEFVPKMSPTGCRKRQEPAEWARGFLRRFLTEQLEIVCSPNAEKMAESLADGKRHSTAVFQSDTFVLVSTFPCGLDEARRTYYGAGYLDYLNSMLRMARNENRECHYVHIQFFCDRSKCWAQFTLFPNEGALGFDPLYTLPVDLLTLEERQKVGLG